MAGIRIADNKRVMVGNRVRRRLRAKGIDSFTDYYAFLTSPAGSSEMPLFLDEITTNETYFFRDPQHYEWLGGEFLPDVVRRVGLRQHPRRLRLWSAACSTGEEPYSMAIELAEKRPVLAGWTLSILGTDLSGAALAEAKAGRYDARAVRCVDPARRLAFFNEDAAAGRWTVKPDVKALVTWKRHNLLMPPGEGPFDCVFIKNVLIYFDRDSKLVVVKNLIEALAPGGYLVVGPTEGVYTMLDGLERVKAWLYRKPGS
jgi:chemotaxis protein methyltransferase CheR